jgi:hypothetical protein
MNRFANSSHWKQPRSNISSHWKFSAIACAFAVSAFAGGSVEIAKVKKTGELEVFRSSTTNSIVLVAEGAGEAASIGSYSIRVMDADGIGEPLELQAGIVRPRDGEIVKVWRGDLRGLGLDEVCIWLCSAGSGSYGSLELFVIGATNLEQVAIPSPGDGVGGYQGHDGFEIDAKGIRWTCPLYGKHVELNIASTNLGTIPMKYPKVSVEEDANADPHGGKARAHYDPKANAWIRDR